MPAGWVPRKLSPRWSARLASPFVGDPAELTEEAFIDLRRGGEGAVALVLIPD
jgi:hypothetical protein